MGKHAQKRMAPPPPKPVVNRPPSTPTTGPRENAAAGGVVVTSPPLLNLVEPPAATAVVSVNNNPAVLETRADRLAEIGQLKSLKESTGCVKKVVELCTLSITPLPLGAAKGAVLDERTPSTATGKARNHTGQSGPFLLPSEKCSPPRHRIMPYTLPRATYIASAPREYEKVNLACTVHPPAHVKKMAQKRAGQH